LVREIALNCETEKLPAPTFRTIKRRLAELDPQLITKTRLGARKAQELYRPVRPWHSDELLPLDLVQIDHTQLDVMVVDESQRRVLGRPWLTLAIDVASRVVTGFYVSLDAPAAISVALVLTHAVLPKDLWLADRQLDLSWPVAGVPETLHLDNAPEFDSQALVRGTQEYGIALQHRPPKQPHFGGHIERLIGTVMGAVHLLPGTTFSSVTDRGAYRSHKTARLTLAELERSLALQIAGVYHHSIHSALQRPPIQAWMEGLNRRRRQPRQPADAETFFLDFLPSERRLIRRDGIRLFNIHYWANVLSPLAGRTKELVLIKYDPRNLSRIFWQDKQGHYWQVPYRDLRLPPHQSVGASSSRPRAARARAALSGPSNYFCGRSRAAQDASWEMLRAFQPESRFNDLDDWNFAAIAPALGGYGERVKTRRELKESIERAFARRGQFALVEVMLPRGVTSKTLARFVSGFKAVRARTT
jgi:putative transposase